LSEFFDSPDEHNGDESKRHPRMFPSASKVSRERQASNKHALSMVRLSRRDSQYGEICSLDPEPVIRLLLEAAGLSEIVQNELVHLAVTSDGANSFHNHTQISIGLKVVDIQAHHCKTKKPLFARSLEQGDENNRGIFQGVQSSEMCTTCIMTDARNKSSMYAEIFSNFFKFTETLKNEGLPASAFGPALAPFIITHPSDLKAIWTTSGRGGNCKKTNFFCHLCSATRHDLVRWREKNQRCNRCIRRNKGKCFHHLVCEDESLGAYVDKYGKDYDEIMAASKLQHDHMMATCHMCDTHIDYHIPTNDPQKIAQYASFIARE